MNHQPDFDILKSPKLMSYHLPKSSLSWTNPQTIFTDSLVSFQLHYYVTKLSNKCLITRMVQKSGECISMSLDHSLWPLHNFVSQSQESESSCCGRGRIELSVPTLSSMHQWSSVLAAGTFSEQGSFFLVCFSSSTYFSLHFTVPVSSLSPR